MSKNNVNPYELDFLAESIHTIPTTTFKSNTIQIYNTTFTFESIITKANVPVGKGVTVYIYHKGLGTLLSKTETDEESKVYVPNLSKHNEYMVVAVDPKDIYNSVIFDINFDLSSKLNNNVTLKYYSIYDVPNLQQLYSYWDTTTDQRIDPSVLFFISNPNFKDDLGISWGMTGTVRSTTIEGARAFTFSNSGENIYVYHNPVPPKSAFTFSAYIYVDSNNRNTTTNNNIFKHHTQSLYIDSNLKLNYKNTDSSNTVELISNSNVILNQWNLASISYDDSKFYLFLNGVLQQSIPNAGGMSYADSTFIIGDSFKGYITQPLMNDICKYTEDFDFLLKAFSYKTNVYSDPTDTLAEYVRVKLSSTRLTYGLRDEVNNISFSSGLENKYFTPLSTNTRMLAYTKQEPKVALGNRDFCIELKVKFKSMTGYPRLICNNNNTWTTNCWTWDVNRTDSANLYSLHVYNIGSWTFNYPVILNELVDLALVREGVNLKYYVNGYLDKTINIGTGSFDDSTTSFIAMAYTMNVNFYELRITADHSRYTTTYEPKQLEWADNELAFDQYKIINLPFKQYTSDNQSVLSFTNTNLSLSTDESLNGTKSAYFNNSKIVSNNKLLITNEKFTIEMFYKPKVESLTGVVSIVSILNSFRLGTKEGLLSFFNGTTWEDSTYLLDDKKFNHIVIQRTGSTIKLLADGNLVLTTTYTIPSGLKTITIGCFNDTEYVNGYVNNLIMYKNITKFEDQYTVPTEEIIVKPPVDLQPEVIVNQYTTSALDFENGLIDQIGTTVWNKQGTGNVTSVNKIFGDNSFETKALGDSLYTNSNIITGGATPFTIEFYALIKSNYSFGNFTSLGCILSKNMGGGDSDQQILIDPTKGNKIYIYRGSNGGNNPFGISYGNHNIQYNTINKFSLTYDGSALRLFVNDKIDNTVGTNTGWDMRSIHPLKFFDNIVQSYEQYRVGTKGIIDNINIHDGIATKVRDYDPNEEFLVVDLAFDGENNSTKIVDNGTGKLNWTVNGNAKISTDQKFDGFSSLYLNNGRVNGSLTDSLWVSDFTIDFDIIRMDDNNSIFMWGRMLCLGDNSTNGGLYIARENMSSNIIVDLYQSGYVRLFTTTDSPLVHNKRVNIKLIRENGVFHLYINNILKFSNSGYTSYNISKTNAMIGGNNVDREYINGYIKNFKIYKDVAIIPESPVGKIQLDFDNNLTDKYNNSTWTNNGVTFDQVNSVKGSSAYFTGNNSCYLNSVSNNNLNFGINDFKISMDIKPLDGRHTYAEIISNGGTWTNGACTIGCFNNGLLRPAIFYNGADTGLGVVTVLNNNYYSVDFTRKKDVSYFIVNDVLIDSKNLLAYNNQSPNINFANNGTNIGKAVWSGSSGITGYKGYIDNFKSIKDYQEPVVIDKPAIHLPLETNAINTGFTPLTINSVGSPTYTTVDGKKCIKFESGKYLTINSNNIFNLGTSSDFYLEFDFYVIAFRNGAGGGTDSSIIRITGNWDNNSSAIQFNSNGNILLYGKNNKLYTTTNNFGLNGFNKLIVKRQNSLVSIILNGVVETVNNFELDFSLNGTLLGAVDQSPYAYLNGYMSNFKMFVGTSEIPEMYHDKKVLDLDFKPTRKSYLFKDNNNKCIIHPVNITQRDYQNSQYCCTFNGTNQYLQLGKNDLLNFGNDDFVINIKFEIYNYTNGWNMILGNGVNTNGGITTDRNYSYISISPENASDYKSVLTVATGISNTSWYIRSTSIKLPLNEIIDAKIICANGDIKILINGVDVTIVNQTSTVSKVQTFNLNALGKTTIGCNADNHYFNGTIYSLKVLRNTTDLSLLEKDVENIPVYEDPLYSSVASLIPFAKDDKDLITSNSWTNTNVTTFNAEAVPSGFAAVFNGSSWITGINEEFTLRTDPFTIEFWFKSTQATNYFHIIFDGRGDNGEGPLIWQSTSNQLRIAYVLSSDIVVSNITLNIWRHFALTRSGTTYYVFIDGILVNTSTANRDYKSSRINIGQTGEGGNTFVGLLSDFRLTKVARYTSTFTPPTKALTL